MMLILVTASAELGENTDITLIRRQDFESPENCCVSF